MRVLAFFPFASAYLALLPLLARHLMSEGPQLYGILLAAIGVGREVTANQTATRAAGLIQRLLDADTQQVPDIVAAMREYRPLVDPLLKSELAKNDLGARQRRDDPAADRASIGHRHLDQAPRRAPPVPRIGQRAVNPG